MDQGNIRIYDIEIEISIAKQTHLKKSSVLFSTLGHSVEDSKPISPASHAMSITTNGDGSNCTIKNSFWYLR